MRSSSIGFLIIGFVVASIALLHSSGSDLSFIETAWASHKEGHEDRGRGPDEDRRPGEDRGRSEDHGRGEGRGGRGEEGEADTNGGTIRETSSEIAFEEQRVDEVPEREGTVEFAAIEPAIPAFDERDVTWRAIRTELGIEMLSDEDLTTVISQLTPSELQALAQE